MSSEIKTPDFLLFFLGGPGRPPKVSRDLIQKKKKKMNKNKQRLVRGGRSCRSLAVTMCVEKQSVSNQKWRPKHEKFVGKTKTKIIDQGNHFTFQFINFGRRSAPAIHFFRIHNFQKKKKKNESNHSKYQICKCGPPQLDNADDNNDNKGTELLFV